MTWVSFIGVFFVFVTSLFAFPYHVDKAILDEIVIHEARYEAHPSSNEFMFDLAMTYAYSGQILKGWKLLKKIPQDYANTVVKTYETLMTQDALEWRYPFKCAFGYFFVGEKQKAIKLFKRVIDIEPNQAWAYGFIALIYGEMGAVEQAITWCHKGLSVEPNATAIHVLLSEGYRKQKKYFKAFKQLLKAGRVHGAVDDE